MIKKPSLGSRCMMATLKWELISVMQYFKRLHFTLEFSSVRLLQQAVSSAYHPLNTRFLFLLFEIKESVVGDGG